MVTKQIEMKRIRRMGIVCAAAVALVVSGASFAGADSKVKGAIVNQSNAQGAANVGIGKGAQANMGSVKLKDSKLKGAVVNQSNAQGAANVAIGKNSTANMGSVNVKNTKVKGAIVNQSNAQGAANVAIGGAESNMGSVSAE